VPPPVDEFRTYREQNAANAGTGLVLPPVDEEQRYHQNGWGLQPPALYPANPQQDK
jgi:hypothetical protein